jgi:hypothetical protein
MTTNTDNHEWPVPEDGQEPYLTANGEWRTWGDDLQETLFALDEAVVLKGTKSERPAAGTEGRWYLAYDEPVIYYDDGSAWQTVAGTGATADTVSADQFLATADGTAGAAAFTFDGDENTGMFRAGEDVLALATANVDALRLDNATVSVPHGRLRLSDGYVEERDLVDAFGGLANGRDLWAAAYGEYANDYRGANIVNIEYHDGSSWVSWSPGDFGNMFDGDTETRVTSIDETHSRFRFTLNVGAYRKHVGAYLVKSYGSGGYAADYDVTYEYSSDQSSWTTAYSASPSTPSYQEAYVGIASNGGDYHRWTFDVDLASGDTFELIEFALLTASPILNPDPIQYTGSASARARGDFDVEGALTEGGTGVALTSRFPLPNSDLANDSVTVAGNSVVLGGSTAVASTDLSDGGDIAHVTDAESITGSWSFDAAPRFASDSGAEYGDNAEFTVRYNASGDYLIYTYDLGGTSQQDVMSIQPNGDVTFFNDLNTSDTVSAYDGYLLRSGVSDVNRFGLKYGSANDLNDSDDLMLTNREAGGSTLIAANTGTAGEETVGLEVPGGSLTPKPNAPHGLQSQGSDVLTTDDERVAASGVVTLSSGTATVGTGITTTGTHVDVFLDPSGGGANSADVKASARAFWDNSAGEYKVEILEDGTSVGNPDIGYEVLAR